MRNITATAFGDVKIVLPYGMMLTRMFKHLKLLMANISSNPLHFDELIFRQMGDETARHHGQSGPRGEVHELDRDKPALEQPK